MWRCLLVVMIVVWLLAPVSVFAATTADVTVTATPLVTSGILDFTITYVSETQLDFSWSYGANTTDIMIRGKWGDYPDDIPNVNTEPSDGFLIYSGNGTSTSWYFDENISTLYIKAWGQNDDDTWQVDTSNTTGFKETTMVLLAFLAFSGVMSFLALRSSYWILKFLAGVSWWIMGMYWISNRPVSITQGGAVDNAVIIALFIIGLAFMFMPFWRMKTESGREIGGRFRLPFMGSEEEESRPPAPTRSERNARYRERVNSALRGRAERRRF